ncbi:MAG: TCP-1/cpn60 chaperonin family protein [Candidatus Lokiarchaeota archaeon]
MKDSELINGVYIDKERVNTQMPESVKDAKIAVIRKKLEVVKGEYDSEIQISSPQDIQRFLDQENQMLKGYLEYFEKLGVNMIINSQDISDKFGAILAKKGIAAIKNLGESDLKMVLKATGATLVDDLKSLSEKDLGYAKRVKFEKLGDDNYTLCTECKNPKAVAIVLKGGLEKITNTAEIALHDVVSIIAKIMDTKTVVAGGGAANIEIAKRLKAYANEISGKEQLAINAFAIALEEIPATLIRNAGLDVVERMTELKAAHKTPQDKWKGIDTITDTIQDNMKHGIVEPAELIKHIIKSGTELSNLILRVDRIINAKGSKEE